MSLGVATPQKAGSCGLGCDTEVARLVYYDHKACDARKNKKKEHKQETGIKTQIIQTCVLLSTLSEVREGEAGCVFALLNSEHSQERVQHGNATWSLRSITTYRHTLTHAHEERETRITQKKYF